MPYLTEELWQKLPVNHSALLHQAYAGVEPTVMLAAYPKADAALIDERAESEMQAVIDLISRVRNIRSEMNIKPGDRIPVLVATGDGLRDTLEASRSHVERLGRTSNILFVERREFPKASARAVLESGAELAIPLEALVDFAKERGRLSRQRDKLQNESQRLALQLADAQFKSRAAPDKVREVEDRFAEVAVQIVALNRHMDALS